jgi:glyoxylase-like metal-dependent hydrolase (beta-lactamase superfamily II)
MGSVCFLVTLGGRRKLFTGDTVFAGSVGRTDMHGGTSKLIIKSVMRIKTFDPDLPIYPGHGTDSTIEEEIRVNPFFDL